MRPAPTTAQDVRAILFELRDADIVLINPEANLIEEIHALGYPDEDYPNEV